MKELQDFVALSITAPQGSILQITNVGRSNLYLHKFEVGVTSKTLENPVLLPVNSLFSYNVNIPAQSIGSKIEAKFYLTDEKNQKYRSLGSITFVQPFIPPQVQQPQISTQQTPPPQIVMMTEIHKTEKFDWNL